MINELISQIDTEKIKQTFDRLSIVRPAGVPSELHSLRLSILQLTYSEGAYEISKIYVNINEQAEVALTADYAFDSLNFYVEDDDYYIFGYDANGVEKVKYFINRNVIAIGGDITYMKKIGGEYYYLPNSVMENPEYELRRQEINNSGKMLCHTIKPDGRVCFYVLPDIELNYSVSSIWI